MQNYCSNRLLVNRLIPIIITLILCLFTNTISAEQSTLLFKNKDVSIYKDRAYYNGIALYDAAKDLERLTLQEATDDCPVNYTYYYHPLSLVGNYYSYESGEFGVLACGTPGGSSKIVTINLADYKDVSLTDIFTQESILKALSEDQWVKKILKETKNNFEPILSFDAFIESINTLSNDRFSPNSFAVLNYDKKNNKAAVRLVGQRYMGYNHFKHVELGLLLEPKDPFKYDLENSTYFTLHAFKNNLTD
ncbi:hypothetical protein GCM10009133_20590 [Cocleimonas flava]